MEKFKVEEAAGSDWRGVLKIWGWGVGSSLSWWGTGWQGNSLEGAGNPMLVTRSAEWRLFIAL